MEDKIKEMISNAVSASATAIIPLVNADPTTSVFAAALQPILAQTINSIYQQLFENNIGKNACKRLGISYIKAKDKANQNLKGGIKLRQDDFFEDGVVYSKAKEIIEGIARCIIDDSDYRKSIFLGNFIGNIGFNKYQIGQEYAKFLLYISKSLSYRQLCLIAYYRIHESLDVSKWAKYFEDESGDANGLDLYTEILQLKNLNLIKRTGSVTLGADLQNSKLNRSGNILYEILSLNEIGTEDIDNLSKIIDVINTNASNTNRQNH